MRERYREDCDIAMYDILPDKDRYAKAALLYGDALQGAYLVLSLDIENSSKLPLCGKLCQWAVHDGSCCDISARKEI